MAMPSSSFTDLLDRTPEVVTMICATLDRSSALAFSSVSRAARPISLPFVFANMHFSLKIADTHHLTVSATMSDAFRFSCRSVRLLFRSFTDKEDAVSQISQLLPKFENLHTTAIYGLDDPGNITRISIALSTSKQLMSLSLNFFLSLERDAQESTQDAKIFPYPLPSLQSLHITCEVPQERDEEDEDEDSDFDSGSLVHNNNLAKLPVAFLHDLIFAHLGTITSLSVKLFEDVVDRDQDLARRFNLDFSSFHPKGDSLKELCYVGPIFDSDDVLGRVCTAFPNLTSLELQNSVYKATPWTIRCYDALKKCRSLKFLMLPFSPHSFDDVWMFGPRFEEKTIPSQYRQITHALAHENPLLEEVQWALYHIFNVDAGPEDFCCKIFVLRDGEGKKREETWELEYNGYWGPGSSRDRSQASHHPSPPLKDIKRRVF